MHLLRRRLRARARLLLLLLLLLLRVAQGRLPRLLRVGLRVGLLRKGRRRTVAVLPLVLLRGHLLLRHVGLLSARIRIARLRKGRARIRARRLLLLLLGLLRDVAQERGEVGGAGGRRLGAAGARVRTGLALGALLHSAEELLEGGTVEGSDEVGEVGLAGGSGRGLGRELLVWRLRAGLAVWGGRPEVWHHARVLLRVLKHGSLLLLGTGGHFSGNLGVKIFVFWSQRQHDAGALRGSCVPSKRTLFTSLLRSKTLSGILPI